MDIDFMCQSALEHHHELIAEADRRRLRSNATAVVRRSASRRSLRAALAFRLRRLADRLEPSTA